MHAAWANARAQGTGSRYPRWYRQHTKAELFVMLTLRDVRDDLMQYVDPMDFWRCATGQIRPGFRAQNNGREGSKPPPSDATNPAR